MSHIVRTSLAALLIAGAAFPSTADAATAVLRVYCVDRTTGRDAGTNDIRVTASSTRKAEEIAWKRFRRYNVCAENGYGYRRESGRSKWLHR